MAEQTRAALEVRSTPDLNAVVERFQFFESLGRPYEAIVDVSLADGAAIDVVAMLGSDAELVIEKTDLAPRRALGVVSRVESPSGPRPDGRLELRMCFVPAIALAGLGLNTRIFQNQTAPDILRAVLEGALGPRDRAVRFELRASYRPREYCVQYQESDLDFATRLMEEEGIFYSFDFEGETEELILHDTNASLTEIAPGESFAFDPTMRIVLARTVNEFVRGECATTDRIAVQDWDWTAPRSISAENDAERGAFPAFESYEHGLGRTLTIADYDEGALRYGSEDGARQAEVRRQMHVSSADVGEGTTSVPELVPGGKLTLSAHPAPDFDGEYIVVEVTHELGLARAGGDADTYSNRFRCIPAATPFRLDRTIEKPAIYGVQTATVVGPAGEEIHTDPHGRIKVQFHWDREGARDDHASCFVRVRQAWAGDGWGVVFLPRIGMEVVVHFMGGDPDRPLVTGCVYNGSNRPPYALPDEKTKSTIKTNSSPGGAGFNELRFEDKAGDEQIYLHAQKDFNEVVEAAHTTHVGGSQSNVVAGNQTQNIGASQKETVGGKQEMTVSGHRTVDVTGHFTEHIDTGETREIKGGSREYYRSGEVRHVTGPCDEDISGGEVHTVTGGKVESCIGKLERKVAGSAEYTATGAFGKFVTGALSLTTTGQIKVDCLHADLEAGGPITASGGPLIERITTTCTQVHTVSLQVGVLKFSMYGVYTTATNLKASIGIISSLGAALKLEGLVGKVEIGGRKGGVNGSKVDTYVIKPKCCGQKNALIGFLMA